MSSVSAFIIFFMFGLHAQKRLSLKCRRKTGSGATVSVGVMSSVSTFIIFFMSGLHHKEKA
jgi:hypothetical protein